MRATAAVWNCKRSPRERATIPLEMTEPEAEATAGTPSTYAVREALALRPTATALVLPRDDGQYDGVAADVLGLLDEAGVVADYASDPMATGVHIEKSADVVLPWILLIAGAVGTAGDLAGTVDGVIFMLRWLLEHRHGAKIELRIAVTRRPDGSETKELKLTAGPGGLDAATERMVRDAIDRMVS